MDLSSPIEMAFLFWRISRNITLLSISQQPLPTPVCCPWFIVWKEGRTAKVFLLIINQVNSFVPQIEVLYKISFPSRLAIRSHVLLELFWMQPLDVLVALSLRPSRSSPRLAMREQSLGRVRRRRLYWNQLEDDGTQISFLISSALAVSVSSLFGCRNGNILFFSLCFTPLPVCPPALSTLTSQCRLLGLLFSPTRFSASKSWTSRFVFYSPFASTADGCCHTFKWSARHNNRLQSFGCPGFFFGPNCLLGSQHTTPKKSF